MRQKPSVVFESGFCNMQSLLACGECSAVARLRERVPRNGAQYKNEKRHIQKDEQCGDAPISFTCRCAVHFHTLFPNEVTQRRRRIKTELVRQRYGVYI